METTTRGAEMTASYTIKCDDCKATIGIGSIRESAAGGRCEGCKRAAVAGYGDFRQEPLSRITYRVYGENGEILSEEELLPAADA
jgi:hypothetical protein